MAATPRPDPPASASLQHPRLHWGALVIFSAGVVICFFHLGTYGLWEPDEARYAEIAREMITLRDYLVPHLNYVPYIEKPPLLYWLTAGAMQVFGVNEFAARFFNAAAALLGLGAVYVFALRAFGRKQALWASIMLITSALYGVMAQVLTTDMLLTAFVTIALFAFFLQWREGGRWFLLMYAAIGLAVMTKGPIGLVLPILIAAIFLWFERDFQNSFRRFHVFAGGLIVVLICAPWFVAITMAQPDFLDFYFIGEHVRRFFESSYSHGEPIYYYLPWIVAGALPWSIVAIFIRWRSLEASAPRRFCLIAAGAIFVTFSLASAKLIPYILPAMPPLMIVMADGVVHAIERGERRLFALSAIFGAAGMTIIAIAFFAARFHSPIIGIVQSELFASGAVLVLTGIASFAAFKKDYVQAAVGIIACASMAVLIIAGYGRIALEDTRSYAALARAIARREPQARLICYPRYIQSLPFYTGRRAILIGAKTELEYGASHAADAPDYFFTRRADLLRLWHQPEPSVLIVDRSAFSPIEAAVAPFAVIAEDRKKIAIANPLAAKIAQP